RTAECLEVSVVRALRRSWKQAGERVAEHLIASIAEDALGGRVEDDDALRIVGRYGCVRGNRDDLLEETLRVGAPRRDVAEQVDGDRRSGATAHDELVGVREGARPMSRRIGTTTARRTTAPPRATLLARDPNFIKTRPAAPSGIFLDVEMKCSGDAQRCTLKKTNGDVAHFLTDRRISVS